MSATLEDVTLVALQLPIHQRLVLAGLLLESDDVSGNLEVDLAWEQEIQNRIRAVDGGGVTGVCYHDVMSAAEMRLAP